MVREQNDEGREKGTDEGGEKTARLKRAECR